MWTRSDGSVEKTALQWNPQGKKGEEPKRPGEDLPRRICAGLANQEIKQGVTQPISIGLKRFCFCPILPQDLKDICITERKADRMNPFDFFM